jgi:hypothetical protein
VVEKILEWNKIVAMRFSAFLLFAMTLTGCAVGGDVSSPYRANSSLTLAPKIQIDANKVGTNQNPTVAEALQQAIEVSQDKRNSSSVPCSGINVSLGGEHNLRRILQDWNSSENDREYTLAPTSGNCSCPSTCVMILLDQTKVGPNNYSLLAFDDIKLKDRHYWIIKEADLSDASAGYSSSIPWVQRRSGERCLIMWKGGKFVCEWYIEG